MTQKTIDMNQVKQVQQLHQDGVAIKEIVRRTGISRKTVRKYLRKMVSIPAAPDDVPALAVTDRELAAIVYDNDIAPPSGKRWLELITYLEEVKKELYKTGVTKQRLWIEYMDRSPDGYRYSQFCYLFAKHLRDTDPAFHWDYRPAEFTQVDFAGKRLYYCKKETGEMIRCEVFVSVLPFSGLLYCESVHSQKTADLAHCINQMVKYVGGLTKTILCDNMKTAVSRADRYEPVFTELCAQLSSHYNTTFSATRPAEPTDKAMVEGAVNIIYRHIYAPMRKKVPGSLEELNRNIREWLDILNAKPYKGSPDSRMDIFNREEKALLKALPETPYQIRKSKQVTVQRNYAVQLPDNKHYYTVPYEHVGRIVQVHYDSRTVEVYYQHDRIAFHVRSSTEPRFNRIKEHMPANHLHMLETQGWTVEKLLERAGWVGPHTRQAADRLLHSSIYPEQNYKACNAMLLLQNKYTRQRLEAACRRSSNITRPTLHLIRNILKSGLDSQPLLFDREEKALPRHPNIRGGESYR
jgi:transposase